MIWPSLRNRFDYSYERSSTLSTLRRWRDSVSIRMWKLSKDPAGRSRRITYYVCASFYFKLVFFSLKQYFEMCRVRFWRIFWIELHSKKRIENINGLNVISFPHLFIPNPPTQTRISARMLPHSHSPVSFASAVCSAFCSCWEQHEDWLGEKENWKERELLNAQRSFYVEYRN